MSKGVLTACIISLIILFAPACHKDTLKEMPAEVKLNDGTMIDCPGGIIVFDYEIYCYRKKGDHNSIRIDRSSVTGYSTKPVATELNQGLK